MNNRFASILLLTTLLAVSCQPRAKEDSNNAAPANNSSVAAASPNAGTSTTVTIVSPDGVNLVGTLFDSAKPNSPALLMLHQWQSDRHSFDDFAKRMQAKGFNVLSIDGRGFGESTKTSDGKPVTAGRTDTDVKAMLGDVGAAFDFLAKQKNVDPNHIGIVGASYGSSLALIYAADNPRVAALALLSPGLNYFGNMQTQPAAEKYGKRPMFLIAAEDDKESADAVRNLAAVNNNGMYGMLVYPNGGHGTALFKLSFPNHERPELAESLEWFFTSRFSAAPPQNKQE
jgi:dienelactone hydrolase